MNSATDFDLRLAEHMARVARVDRDAWMREASVSTGVGHTRGISTVVASIRQWVGVAVVRAGERLQGTPAGRAADRAAAV
jgi:hypothetical protein